MTGVAMRIPLVDLRAQYEGIRLEIDEAVTRVLRRGEFILGEEVLAFEREWAAWCEVDHAVGVSSCTDAIRLALVALGVGPGAEVITVANTFFATAEAIAATGARPVFVDTEPLTQTMDPARLAAALTPLTAAIVVVHLYGQPADMDAIMDIASAHGVPVVEDAAQAHGARYRGRRVGGIGHLGCFSFFPAKNLGAYGDAGAVVTNDTGAAARIRRLRDHGRASKHLHVEVGHSCRLDALQAAVLRVKLPHLERWTARRRHLDSLYREALADVPGVDCVGLAPERESAHHLMVVELDGRDRVLQRLQVAGVGAGVHYPVPVHLQPGFAHLGYAERDLPVTERAARRVLSLPLYPEMAVDHVRAVVEQLRLAIAG